MLLAGLLRYFLHCALFKKVAISRKSILLYACTSRFKDGLKNYAVQAKSQKMTSSNLMKLIQLKHDSLQPDDFLSDNVQKFSNLLLYKRHENKIMKYLRYCFSAVVFKFSFTM